MLISHCNATYRLWDAVGFIILKAGAIAFFGYADRLAQAYRLLHLEDYLSCFKFSDV